MPLALIRMRPSRAAEVCRIVIQGNAGVGAHIRASRDFDNEAAGEQVLERVTNWNARQNTGTGAMFSFRSYRAMSRHGSARPHRRPRRSASCQRAGQSPRADLLRGWQSRVLWRSAGRAPSTGAGEFVGRLPDAYLRSPRRVPGEDRGAGRTGGGPTSSRREVAGADI
jgi:hypothetical protein